MKDDAETMMKMYGMCRCMDCQNSKPVTKAVYFGQGTSRDITLPSCTADPLQPRLVQDLWRRCDKFVARASRATINREIRSMRATLNRR